MFQKADSGSRELQCSVVALLGDQALRSVASRPTNGQFTSPLEVSGQFDFCDRANQAICVYITRGPRSEFDHILVFGHVSALWAGASAETSHADQLTIFGPLTW